MSRTVSTTLLQMPSEEQETYLEGAGAYPQWNGVVQQRRTASPVYPMSKRPRLAQNGYSNGIEQEPVLVNGYDGGDVPWEHSLSDSLEISDVDICEPTSLHPAKSRQIMITGKGKMRTGCIPCL
jgi:hypothetical protein